MTDPTVDAERRAAEVVSNHRPSSRLIDGRRVGVCSCRQWTGDLVTGHGAHVAAMLTQAGVLADAQHDAAWSETLRNDGVYEYTITGDCHGTWEQPLRRLPARHSKPGAWHKVDAVPADADYPSARAERTGQA